MSHHTREAGDAATKTGSMEPGAGVCGCAGSGLPPEIAAHLRELSFRRPPDPDAPFEAVGDGVPGLLGVSAEDLCSDRGRRLMRLTGRHRERVTAEMARAAAEGAAYCCTYRLRGSVGHEPWISERGFPMRSSDGEIVAFEGFFADATESVAAGLEIHEQRDRLRHALAAAPMILFALDREGRFIFGEGRGIDMLGFEPSGLSDQSLAEVFADLPDVVEAAERALRGEEFSFISSVGPVTFETHYAPLYSAGGELDGAVAVSLDVTKRERALQELHESRDQLLRVQKMEAVGRLAGGIAHDFNNLLTVILGLGRPLLKELDIDDPVREDIGEICGSAEQAAALTRQLLAFSRREPTSAECVDLNQVVRRTERILAHLLGEDRELVLDLAPQLDAVCCDPAQIEQILVNLAANARDATPAGGEVVVRTVSERVDASQASRLGLERAGRYNVLHVTDTGEGMDEATREHIFDPFFTTREPGQGTGLGLAIVYGAAKECGGGVGVKSESGVGTTFSVYLRPHGVLELPDEVDEEDPLPQSAGTILLVEDEEAIRRLVLRILSAAGYRVIEAADGGQALEIAESFEGSLHLLVTDVVMPGISGGELARRLCQSHPDLEVLFLSGYLEDMANDDAGFRHAGRFLQKPFTDKELLERIQAILD